VEVVASEAELLEVGGALDAVAGLAHFLDRWHQQRNEDGDDGNHHQQLDQGEAGAPALGTWRRHPSNPGSKVRNTTE
jgi:hypothetical protein